MKPPLAIYIHWPFCKSKCPYCDFNSHVREDVEVARWKSALLAELQHMAKTVGTDYDICSVFFGGGTPSLMPPELVAALIQEIGRLWNVDTNTLEITLEANPTSSEAEKFKGFRAAGVNRLSLGVQSLNADALSFLGREHSSGEALKAVEMASDIFDRHSFDLIYARPEQTLAEWENELRRALPYAKGHLSLYQLTIEQGTAFQHLYSKGKLLMPEDGLAADFYQLTADILAEHDIYAYEISNYAKMGDECRHNIAYWQGDDYIGVGPGAHGRIHSLDGQARATSTLKSPERWLSSVEKDGHGIEVNTPLSPTDRADELLLAGLRLAAGINLTSFNNSIGNDIYQYINKQELTKLIDMGMMEISDDHLRTTHHGTLLIDSILGKLLD